VGSPTLTIVLYNKRKEKMKGMEIQCKESSLINTGGVKYSESIVWG
jgi:hypothetical protein